MVVQGFPAIPEPKTYRLAHGGTYDAPSGRVDEIAIAAEPSTAYSGAPLEPTGDPMRDAVGPAAYAKRSTEPDLTLDGQPRIVPMRVATEFSIAAQDPDPRGMPVYGADDTLGGTVSDVWVDRSEPQIRYLEVETRGDAPKRVLVPIVFCRIDRLRREVVVDAITGEQFGGVPTTANPDLVSLREEDQISAYYGGGTLYATPERLGPIL
jgi:photosynthetic reaction center H subunit